jgi:methionyl aminopeptidase
MPVILKSNDELKLMRDAGRLVAQTLEKIRGMVRPGLDIKDVEKVVAEEFRKAGAKETFRNYRPAEKYPPYPSNICISVNDELVHGIPRHRVLKDGDIVTFDLGATLKGYVGDAAITVAVGSVRPEVKRLMEVTEASLWAGIRAAQTGTHLNDICGAIEDTIRAADMGVVQGYGGHGVGRSMHEEPHVTNHRMRFRGTPLKTGLVIALEPMVTLGKPDVEELGDGWTVRTKDGSLCCHFEHTIAIRQGCEPEVLTLP